MKLAIMRSIMTREEAGAGTQYLQHFNVRYAERVIGNQRGARSFCSACGQDCIRCRDRYDGADSSSIAEVLDFPAVLPHLLEKPAAYLPEQVASHDVLLAIHVHEQILIELLRHCSEWGARAAVVPIEAPDWISASTKRTAYQICERTGIELCFPEPFCSFDPPRGSVLADFRERFRIGAPECDLVVENNEIRDVNVRVSAACGATYYVARWLVGRKLSENVETEVISKRLHCYPCTASMKWDNEIGDTPLHLAVHAHYKALAPDNAAPRRSDRTFFSPLGVVVHKPVSREESLENAEKAKELILAELSDSSVVRLDHIKSKSRLPPSAISTALILLKRENKIRVEAARIYRV